MGRLDPSEMGATMGGASLRMLPRTLPVPFVTPHGVAAIASSGGGPLVDDIVTIAFGENEGFARFVGASTCLSDRRSARRRGRASFAGGGSGLTRNVLLNLFRSIALKKKAAGSSVQRLTRHELQAIKRYMGRIAPDGVF